MGFESFAKIARLNRECVITEKIDGTNAQVFIWNTATVTPEQHEEYGLLPGELPDDIPWLPFKKPGFNHFAIAAGSRNRWLTLDNDNHGFARWVTNNADELIKLDHGRHFGEWWGSGIGKRYSDWIPKGEKRFSLFNVARWGNHENVEDRPECCDVVPVIEQGLFHSTLVHSALAKLAAHGSYALPGCNRPEGVVICHKAARQLFKVTLEKDEVPKALVGKEIA